jgi:hypothetical protein
MPLVVASMSLGGIAGGVLLWLRSWSLFAVVLVVVLALDALMDFRFRRLELVEPQT